MQPRRCASLLSNGNLCQQNPMDNQDYCTRHYNARVRKLREDREIELRLGPAAVNQCKFIYPVHVHRCERQRGEDPFYCVDHALHVAAERRKIQRRRDRAIAIQAEGAAIIQPILEVALDREPPLNWQEQLRMWYTTERDLRLRGFLQRAVQEFATMSEQRFTIREYEEQIRVLNHERFAQMEPPAVVNNVMGFIAGAIGGFTQRLPGREVNLGQLANDKQNTHTTVVVKQTNKGLEKLLNIVIPADQNTLYEIWKLWFIEPKSQTNCDNLLKVFQDMNKWYNTKSCKTTNDELYKHALDGLWYTIQNTNPLEVRNELITRLTQEIVDSYDTCCEGHISRIVNTLAGFDKDFIPERVAKLDLQHEMGKISQSNMSVSAKKAEATKIMDRLNISQNERVVWLDAFDE
jgi:hypothetical protein